MPDGGWMQSAFRSWNLVHSGLLKAVPVRLHHLLLASPGNGFLCSGLYKHFINTEHSSPVVTEMLLPFLQSEFLFLFHQIYCYFIINF